MTLPQRLITENDTTPEGHVSGGQVHGKGLTIQWQRGPILAPTDVDLDGETVPVRDSNGNLIGPTPNGALVEDVLEALIQRLQALNSGPLEGAFAGAAILSLERARDHLEAREADRKERGVLGTPTP